MKDDRRTQWLRGVLDLCVLAALTRGERYGYELSQQLAEAGLGQVKGGTLYPLLARLEKAGQVETQWRAGTQGPGRKYYSLTKQGRRYVKQQAAEWKSFAHLIDSLLQMERK
jgi:PadR family transcriptional regulator